MPRSINTSTPRSALPSAKLASMSQPNTSAAHARHLAINAKVPAPLAQIASKTASIHCSTTRHAWSNVQSVSLESHRYVCSARNHARLALTQPQHASVVIRNQNKSTSSLTNVSKSVPWQQSQTRKQWSAAGVLLVASGAIRTTKQSATNA